MDTLFAFQYGDLSINVKNIFMNILHNSPWTNSLKEHTLGSLLAHWSVFVRIRFNSMPKLLLRPGIMLSRNIQLLLAKIKVVSILDQKNSMAVKTQHHCNFSRFTALSHNITILVIGKKISVWQRLIKRLRMKIHLICLLSHEEKFMHKYQFFIKNYKQKPKWNANEVSIF